MKKHATYNLVAEENVLGSMLISSEALSRALDKLKEEYFFEKRNRIIFNSIRNIASLNKNINIELVVSKLEKENLLEEIGVEYLTLLSSKTPVLSNIDFYIDEVINTSIRRNLLQFASALSEEVTDDIDVDEILTNYENKFREIQNNKTSDSFSDINEVMQKYIANIEKIAKNGDELLGIDSGYKELNHKTNGWKEGELIILAARPSVGKTAFALNLLMNAAKKNASVLFFSLEMGETSIMNRIVSMETLIESNKLSNANLSSSDWVNITSVSHSIGQKSIIIDDTPGIKINEIKLKARRLKKEKKLDIIIIDYLQLITTNQKNENRQQEVSEISRQLKSLARELEIPIIALSQLSRGVESRTDKRPMLSDIRESGSIEQDADIILFLYRENYYDRETEDNTVEIIISKNRNGATGHIILSFQREFNKFIAHTNIQEN